MPLEATRRAARDKGRLSPLRLAAGDATEQRSGTPSQIGGLFSANVWWPNRPHERSRTSHRQQPSPNDPPTLPSHIRHRTSTPGAPQTRTNALERTPDTTTNASSQRHRWAVEESRDRRCVVAAAPGLGVGGNSKHWWRSSSPGQIPPAVDTCSGQYIAEASCSCAAVGCYRDPGACAEARLRRGPLLPGCRLVRVTNLAALAVVGTGGGVGRAAAGPVRSRAFASVPARSWGLCSFGAHDHQISPPGAHRGGMQRLPLATRDPARPPRRPQGCWSASTPDPWTCRASSVLRGGGPPPLMAVLMVQNPCLWRTQRRS